MSCLLAGVLSLLSILGLSLPIYRRLSKHEPLDRLGYSLGLVMVFIGAYGGLAYVLNFDRLISWVLPSAGAFCLLYFRSLVVEVWRVSENRLALIAWAFLFGWGGVLLSLLVSYSGGGWAGDWLEHYERLQFFLHHWPRDRLFLDSYQLTARPPLVNLIAASLLSPMEASYENYQIVFLLLATLAVFPLLMILRVLSGRLRVHQVLVLLLLLLCNAGWNQNTTFAWTKLPTAFMVLLAVRCFIPGGEGAVWRVRLGWFFMGAGVLAHYSAIPWAIACFFARLWLVRNQLLSRRAFSETTEAILIVVVSNSPWLLFAFIEYGATGTLLSNSSALTLSTSWVEQLGIGCSNIFNTLVPFLLREVPLCGGGFLFASSGLALIRDVAFNCYQVCLLLCCGLAGLLVFVNQLLVYVSARSKAGLSGANTAFWLVLVGTVIPLGILVHTRADTLGLAHICLQPLGLLGVVYILLNMNRIGRFLQGLFWCLLGLDFFLGSFIHFYYQALSGAIWPASSATDLAYVDTLSISGRLNLMGKQAAGLHFLGDRFRDYQLLICSFGLLLLFALVVGVYRTRHGGEATERTVCPRQGRGAS